jgi:hypothetical protein
MRPPPADETDLAPDEIAAAATEMERILEQHPQLSDFDFGLADFYKTHAERVAKFHEDRETIRDPRSLAEFIVARGWLRQFAKLKSFNKRGTSYGLKHVAEHGPVGPVSSCDSADPVGPSWSLSQRLLGREITRKRQSCGCA